MSFTSLGLSKPLLRVIAKQGYQTPYPIQQEAIPAILAGSDVLGIARTGSGKTAGYVLPLLERLQRQRSVDHLQVLVLVPTRELAAQVADVFQTFSASLPRPLKTVAVFGGVSVNPQLVAFRDADVLVATPGRLLDLLTQRPGKLAKIETLVLDEADKMLELGFADELNQVLAQVPVGRQTVLFSATLGEAIQQMNSMLLHEPVQIQIADEETPIDQIQQTAYRVTPERKSALLRHLIKSRKLTQVLVFVSSTRSADNLVAKLGKNGIRAMAMHGHKTQNARTDSLASFKLGEFPVLVATDLLARGIDIQFLPHVINYELPRSPKDYIHRIGRTGRADASGEAISLVTPDDEHHFSIIQKKMGKRIQLIDAATLSFA
ncbi:DEAD/DEAH box helicase [Fibrella arboris]|uniref:DEAD/DEAH box helicase n=1 Tax=Fibrella arboris TaxID=3242486 RepID=UPI0035222FEA